MCRNGRAHKSHNRCSKELSTTPRQFFCSKDNIKQLRDILNANKVRGGPRTKHCYTPANGIAKWLRDAKNCNIFYSCNLKHDQTRYNITGICAQTKLAKNCPASQKRTAAKTPKKTAAIPTEPPKKTDENTTKPPKNTAAKTAEKPTPKLITLGKFTIDSYRKS